MNGNPFHYNYRNKWSIGLFLLRTLSCIDSIVLFCIHVCTINVFIIHESCTTIIKTPPLIGNDVRFYVFIPLYQDQNLIFKPDNDLILHKIFIKIISRLEKYDLHATPKKDSFPLSTKKKMEADMP